MVTVITVVYNCAAELTRTVESVLAQNCACLEYVIVDGGSTDGSVDVLRRHERRLASWISEPDQGIFDAMNKGINLAHGEWIIFMNAGDRFCDDAVVSSILPILSQSTPTILYSDTLVDYGNYTVNRRAGSPEQLWKGSQFCHQSAFIRRVYHSAHPYNAANRLCADFEFFHGAWHAGRQFLKIDGPIAVITPDGVSDRHQFEVLTEWRRIVIRARTGLRVRAYYAFRILMTRVALRVRQRLPRKLLQQARQGRACLARLLAH